MPKAKRARRKRKKVVKKMEETPEIKNNFHGDHVDVVEMAPGTDAPPVVVKIDAPEGIDSHTLKPMTIGRPLKKPTEVHLKEYVRSILGQLKVLRLNGNFDDIQEIGVTINIKKRF